MPTKSLIIVSLLAVVAACATPSPPLPLPPPATEPPAAAIRRAPARPAQPPARPDARTGVETVSPAPGAAPEPAAAAEPADAPPVPVATAAAPTPPPPPAPAPAATTWRVRSDGVVGCADAAGLRLLQQVRATPGASPRLIAQAHRDGGCLTAFTNRAWVLEQSDGEFVRLRLAEDGSQAVLLWFSRMEVTPTGGG